MTIAYQTFWNLREYRALLAHPHKGGRLDSLDPVSDWQGWMSYTDFVRSLDYPGITYQEQIQHIDTLSQAVTAQVMPHIADVRRVQSYGRSGHTVRWQALMQGNLAQAWKRMDTQQIAGRKSLVTLLLPGRFRQTLSANTIMWTMVANIALAQALERTGTSCEMWTVCLGMSVWHDHTDAYTGIRLKNAGSAWNIQDIVPIAHAAWLRRGIFHTWESLQQQHGGMDDCYGYGFIGEDLRQRFKAWAAYHELPQCVVGANEYDGIWNFASALAWVQAKAAHLTGEN